MKKNLSAILSGWCETFTNIFRKKDVASDAPSISGNQTKIISGSLQPIVFQNVSTTQGIPMDQGYHTRRAMAEQQFRTMTPDHAVMH